MVWIITSIFGFGEVAILLKLEKIMVFSMKVNMFKKVNQKKLNGLETKIWKYSMPKEAMIEPLLNAKIQMER